MVISYPKLRNKHSINFQISPGTSDKNQNSNEQVCTIKISSDSDTSTSNVHGGNLYKRNNFFEQKRNKRSTIAGTFNTTYITKFELELPDLNYTADIVEKLHSTDDLLNYDLILSRDILHEYGIIFYFENKSIT